MKFREGVWSRDKGVPEDHPLSATSLLTYLMDGTPVVYGAHPIAAQNPTIYHNIATPSHQQYTLYIYTKHHA